MPDAPARQAEAADKRPGAKGPGRILVATYGVFALAATGRSVLQIVEHVERAPVAYTLSAVAAVIYIVATVTLALGDRRALRVARVACLIELVGVVVVGVLSYVVPEWFPDRTVWSHFGSGYGYVPVLLPVLGLWWLQTLDLEQVSGARERTQE